MVGRADLDVSKVDTFLIQTSFNESTASRPGDYATSMLRYDEAFVGAVRIGAVMVPQRYSHFWRPAELLPKVSEIL